MIKESFGAHIKAKIATEINTLRVPVILLAYQEKGAVDIKEIIKGIHPVFSLGIDGYTPSVVLSLGIDGNIVIASKHLSSTSNGSLFSIGNDLIGPSKRFLGLQLTL